MQTRFRILVLALALVSPAAAAWGGKGQYEPDTHLDRTGGWMWPASDTQKHNEPGYGSKVYFNSITLQNTGYVVKGMGPNSNFATVQSERQAWPGQVAALLGVWKDCNKDGYIGLGDNVAFEYRSELLLGDVSVCPPKPTTVPGKNLASFDWIGAHNDAVWVREFIPIGPDVNNPNNPSGFDGNPFDINDKLARVWADWGTPNSPPPSSRCFIVTPEPGTFHSTGGMINYVDCLDSYFVAEAFSDAAVSAGLDNIGAGQISFKDSPQKTQDSASILNQRNPYGDVDGAPMATAFDCSQPLAGPTAGLRVPRPVVPSTNTAGTLGGTVEHTENSFEDCDREDGGMLDAGNVPYSAESPGAQNGIGIRNQNDFPMVYSEGTRPGLGTRAELGAADSKDKGLRAWDSEGLWVSGTRMFEDRNPLLDRANVRTADVIAEVQYLSAYAFISPAAVTKYHLLVNPTNKAGVYGSSSCPEIGPGKGISANKWFCNPADWGACGGNSEGYQCQGSIEGNPNVDISVKVGGTYRLADVDCYDTSAGPARSAGVSWGTLTGTKCV